MYGWKPGRDKQEVVGRRGEVIDKLSQQGRLGLSVALVKVKQDKL